MNTIRRRIRVFTLLTMLAAMVVIPAGPGHAQAPPPGDGLVDAEGKILLEPLFLENHQGPMRVVVELREPSGAEVFALAAEDSESARGLLSRTQAERLNADQTRFIQRAREAGAAPMEIFRTQNVLNAVALEADQASLERIGALEGVKAIYPLQQVSLQNEASVPLTGAPVVWQMPLGSSTALGQGMRIGIIDTGIDYTHRNFRGTGTVDAYYGNVPSIIEPGSFPTPKVAGGYDFVGDRYDASAMRTAEPDEDPLDCNGHGTLVAGIAAGYGLWFTTRTPPDPAQYASFAGKPAQLYREEMGIGPGVAPLASLYALKIFGCQGTSEYALPALEWALDPNRDGNPSDRLDVVNLSFGTPMGVPDNAMDAAIRNASAAGMIVVGAAGNSGDAYYMVNSPGSATRAISVAASQDGSTVGGAIQVTPAGGSTGFWMGAYNSTAYFWQENSPMAAQLRYLGQGVSSGCNAFGDGVFVNRAALLDWTWKADGEPECGSSTRVWNAYNAGAKAVVIAYDRDPLDYSISGIDRIPAAIVSKSNGDWLKAHADATITFLREFNGWEINPYDSAKEDLVLSVSARGPRRGDNLLKPDLSAPGSSVFSSLIGSGVLGYSLSGSSMAAPHVSGAMALLRQLHPTWTVEELKALVMNYAVQDIAYPAVGGNIPSAPDRVGAGRLRVDLAARSSLIAYGMDVPGAVSVSFGEVKVVDTQAGPDLTTERRVRLVNKGGAAVAVDVAFDSRYPANPGVSYSLFLGGAALVNPVNVPANGAVEIIIRQNLDGARLAGLADPAIDKPVRLGGVSFRRNFLGESGGYLTITPRNNAPRLRVPVYAVHRAAGERGAVSPAFALGQSDKGTLTIPMRGPVMNPQLGRMVVRPFQLLYLDTRPPGQGYPGSAAELAAVGVTSDYQRSVPRPSLNQTNLYFALMSKASWSSPNEVEFRIYIDINGDNTGEWVLFNSSTRLFNGVTTDAFFSVLCPVPVPSVQEIPYYCSVVNTINAESLSPWGSFDANPFNTNVMVLTVPAGWLGGNNLRYQEMRFFVESSSRNWPAADNKADLKKYCLGSELFNLTQSTTNLPISEDNRDLNLAWNMNAYVRDQSKPQGLLLVHYQNGQTRGEVLQMEQPLATLTWDDLKRFSGEPGAVVEIPLDFMQNAVLQANFTFSVSGIPAGWSASVSPANARASQHSSIPLTLTVRIPATAPLGSIAALRVEAKSAEHPSLAPSAAVPVKVVRKGFFPFLAR